MLDLVYVLVTISFFTLMLLYIRGCKRLGEATNADTEERQP